jgi:hypothetical protein
MKKILAYGIAAAALAAAPSAASATTLLTATNLADQTNSSVSLVFTAGSSSTTVSFAGFNVPSFINLTNIELTLTGSSTNLLGQTFSFAPASSSCTDASQTTLGVGSFGTNNLHLGSVCVGDFDTFSQTVSTAIGSSLTLSFLVSNTGSPNGLVVNATEAAVAGVPEPATWATMLLGFGAMGLFIRFGRKRKALATAAA